ncbi:MAG: hypothetical protein V4864_24190 [Pseudomonadota bacterium]
MYMRITYEEPNGTAGAGITPGIYSQYPLNTVTHNMIPGASLAANQVLLLPGIYDITATLSKSVSGFARAAIYDATAGQYLGKGPNNAPNGAPGGPWTHVHTIAVLGVPSAIELQQYGGITGTPCSFGDNEVYAEVNIRKIDC